jgi:hypothetical protein
MIWAKNRLPRRLRELPGGADGLKTLLREGSDGAMLKADPYGYLLNRAHIDPQEIAR